MHVFEHAGVGFVAGNDVILRARVETVVVDNEFGADDAAF